MEIDKAERNKKALEAVILKRLRDYEKETGLSVTDISLTTSQTIGHRGSVVQVVEIEAQL